MTGSACSHDRKHKLAILPHCCNALAVLGKVACYRKQFSEVFKFLSQQEEKGGHAGRMQGGGTKRRGKGTHYN